jgi:hydrogenase maturation protein HypF
MVQYPLIAEIHVTGIVQGVGFRPFIYRIATANNLTGYVRNRGDATVKIVIEGTQDKISEFLKDLKNKKPSISQIQRINVTYKDDKKEFSNFKIIHSSKVKELKGSVIPPDIAICDECVKELRSPEDPRLDHFFITCTNCGPRYTTILQLPYDRKNTTMQNFKMCSFCQSEYKNPTNRRFHAQTVACPNCGPKAILTTNQGKPIDDNDPIRKAGRLIEEGNILAIKGYGGFHVATAAKKDSPIRRLRTAKHRVQKPFAIMARDMETIHTFANVSLEEEKMLSSPQRPIILLDKSRDYYLSELITPGLHNIGVMLPYTGMHMMLFDRVKEPAFVMTSANPPNEPIVMSNIEAYRKLGSTVDYFLIHTRDIAQRCDDSVIRFHNKQPSFIRRSRGYAPAPIHLKQPSNKCVLAVGAEENVTACIIVDDKAFISQYIGDVENLETLFFLEETIHHLQKLTNVKIEIVACDLHPKFATSTLAMELAESFGTPLKAVQHHHAHIMSLMGEYGLDEMIGIACDGYGYGLDGKAWGGETLLCVGDEFKRVGHLEEQPLVGGDQASRYPVRMGAGMLRNVEGVEDWLMSKKDSLPHGKEEVDTILNQLEKGRLFKTTTSCGRVLDGISAILDVCKKRTYQGEPAMKLESIARGGKNLLKLVPEIHGQILDTSKLAEAIFDTKDKLSEADLAYSAQSYLAEGLAQLAITAAMEDDVKSIGFSGGVGYNKHIITKIKMKIENEGFRFYAHQKLPAGDGGISFGQAFKVALESN